MNRTHTSELTNDVTRELDALRTAAAESSLRILQDLELGWVSGGDPSPTWDGSTPPGP
jgi:hypothetical protein